MNRYETDNALCQITYLNSVVMPDEDSESDSESDSGASGKEGQSGSDDDNV